MKIAINATIVDDMPSGLGIYSLNMILALAKAIRPEDNITVFTSFPEAFKDCGVKIKKVFKFVQPKYGIMAGLIRFLWTQFVYPIRLLKGRYDIVYHTTHHAILLATLSQVMTVHDLLAIKFPKRYIIQHFYFRYVMPILLKKCVFIISVSQNSKDDISSYYNISKEKIKIIGNSYDSSRFHRHVLYDEKIAKTDSDYLLVVGASYMNKNIERVLCAYSMINDKIHMKLVIAGGRKSYINALKEKSKDLDIEEDVKFLDYVSSEELVRLYRRAEALIFVSLYEGFGIPALEAMASGCPVLASNTSSLPEVCGDAAYYVDPYSVDSIANGILAVVNDKILKASLISKGFERIKLFSWDSSAKKAYEIFKELA